MSVVSILVALVGLGFLILVHEFGHFIVAKLFGMRVEEFSIGFGRYLVKRRVGETVYGISMLPLGGYVRVTGMHEEEFQARVEAVQNQGKFVDPEAKMTGRPALTDEEVIQTPLERRYYARPVWQRLIFIVAGVTMNVVAAFVLLFFVGLQGYQEARTDTSLLGVVEEGSPAAAAGLQAGDTIISIAGQPVSDWAEVQEAIQSHPDQPVEVAYEREGAPQTTTVAMTHREDGKGRMGVGPDVVEVQPGLIDAVSFAGSRTAGLFGATFTGIGQLISGSAPLTGPEGGLSGPVGIISISSEAVRGGWFPVLLAFISVQLAILNMLPLLPLDGGHVLFSLIEKVLGRAVSLRTFERISMVGISLFLLLALVATSNDIGRLFSGQPG